MTTPANENDESQTLKIQSSEILTLIQHHLSESGLTSGSKQLQAETSVGNKGLLPHAHSNLIAQVSNGQWGHVLETLSSLTLDKDRTISTGSNRRKRSKQGNNSDSLENILIDIHEMAILELGDVGETDLAFATLRVSHSLIDMGSSDTQNDMHHHHESGVLKTTLSQSIESRLHALVALRSVHHRLSGGTSMELNTSSPTLLLPPDYYGKDGMTKNKRRTDIAKRLTNVIPIIPPSRLVSLLQQAIKWQIHTGEIPMIKELWNDDDDDDDGDGKNDTHQDQQKKKKKKSHHKKRFDLVMGTVDVQEKQHSSNSDHSSATFTKSKTNFESIPLDPYSTIKFAKKTTVTSAVFLTDRPDDASLITGSSDGFIEIYDSRSKYVKLRIDDLEYQRNDDLMYHDHNSPDDGSSTDNNPAILSLTVNSDATMIASGDSYGSIYIWNVKSGKCLRQFNKVHTGAVTCLDFSRDGEDSSRILSGCQDGICREFGLRSKRMLKEFRGHGSFVNSCAYVITDSISMNVGNHDNTSSTTTSGLQLLVVTSSADGTVRVWDGHSAEVKFVLNPSISVGPTAVVKQPGINSELTSGDGYKNIHSVIMLHTPNNSMIVVPRGPKAYLMMLSGEILRIYENTTKKESKTSTSRGDFVAATVSPSNKWLYAVTDDGACLCFDIHTSKLETSISDFGIESTGGVDVEIDGLTHHPHKGMLAVFSSSKVQKRGLLTLWK